MIHKMRCAAILVIPLLVLISPNLWVKTSYALTVNVSGRVVDEDGDPLENVKVEAYAYDEAYGIEVHIGRAWTDHNGSFNMELSVGREYTLKFIKSGYAEVSKKISVGIYGTGRVDLGNITLIRAIRLFSTILSLSADSGETISLPFHISNVGSREEIIELEVFSPPGWTARILDQADREVKKIKISPGGSLNLRLESSIPAWAEGRYSLKIVAIGELNSTLKFLIEVKRPSEPLLSCRFPGKSVTTGGTVQFGITLENPFRTKMRFRLSFSSIPSDWVGSIRTVDGESISEVILGPRESVSLIVEVEVPEWAEAGKTYNLTVKAETSDGKVADLLPLSISLIGVKEEIGLAAKFLEVTVEAGRSLEYPITILNLGDTNVSLYLSAEPPEDWKVTFKSGGLEISRIFLEAGRSESLIVEVTPPSTVSIGAYTIPIRLVSESGKVYAETRLRARIIGSYKMAMKSSTFMTSVTAGGSTSFTIRIMNTGHTPITSVRLKVELPKEWESSVSPAQVGTLKPMESSAFNVEIRVPSNTVAGDYLITITGISDQTRTDPLQIRVTVTVPTSWGLIGLGLIAIMIVILILAFLKFKRR